MKVMIITCHTPYNYGAVLQAYALQTYIEKSHQDVKIIDYCPSRFYSFQFRRFLILLVRWPDYVKCRKVFGNFLKKYLHLTAKATTFSEIKKLGLEADLYIAGSDQIWNVNLPNGNDPCYYLEFVEHGKKISYAASIALEELSGSQKKVIKNMVCGLDSISVREESAVRLLNECGFYNVYHVIDPVYLLTREEWISFSSNREYQEEYILIYGFCRQREIYSYARKLAGKLDCNVYAINTLWSDIRFDMDKYFWVPPLEEFVNLFHHAKAVVTNSFHGLAFSLIFHKNMHVFETIAGGSVRLKDMLKLIRLEERLIAKDFKEILVSEIDFEKVDEIIDKMTQFSKEYLNSFLKRKE